MADSQRLTAIKNFQTATRTIQTGDGFNYTIKTDSVVLDPVDLATISPTALPFVCLIAPKPVERTKVISGPRGQVKETFKLIAQMRVDANGTLAGRKITAAENLIADFERMIARNLNLGGVALDVWMESPTEIDIAIGNDNAIGIEIPFEVKLQARAYGAP